MKNIKIEKPENFYKTRNYWDPWKCMLEYSELEDKHLEKITFFGQPGYYTDERIYRDPLPDGIYVYDIESCEEGVLLNVRECVMCYWGGTLIFFEPLEIPEPWYLEIGEGLCWVDDWKTA